MKQRLFLVLVPLFAVLVPLTAFELGARFFVTPSDQSYGQLMGIELPPLKAIAELRVSPVDTHRRWFQKHKPNPLNLTIGDLWGISREDPLTGYAPMENSRSDNGWWQANNLGARSRRPTYPPIPPGYRRLLVFGESYAQSSRVAQDATWFSQLERRVPKLEIVNLSVDGFGMGQAYLRYQHFAARLDYDTVMFIFVPECDLWRDINTMRYLGEGWEAYTILPRFVLDGDDLRLVPGPYPIGSEIYRRDFPTLTPRVRGHLLAYDRFYFPLLYENRPVWGQLLTYKLMARMIGEKQREWLARRTITAISSEAMQITRRIFRRVSAESRAAGKHFVLVVLPDVRLLKEAREPAAGERLAAWNARVEAFRADGITTIDLLPEMRRIPASRIDNGYDGSHYGPAASEAIARLLDASLGRLGLLQRVTAE